jgi:hypothetical protein
MELMSRSFNLDFLQIQKLNIPSKTFHPSFLFEHFYLGNKEIVLICKKEI